MTKHHLRQKRRSVGWRGEPRVPGSKRPRLTARDRELALRVLRRKELRPSSRISRQEVQSALDALSGVTPGVSGRVARNLLREAYPRWGRPAINAEEKSLRRSLQQGRLPARCSYYHLGLSENSNAEHIIYSLRLLKKRCGCRVRVLLLNGLHYFDDRCLKVLLQLLCDTDVKVLGINFGEL